MGGAVVSGLFGAANGKEPQTKPAHEDAVPSVNRRKGFNCFYLYTLKN